MPAKLSPRQRGSGLGRTRSQYPQDTVQHVARITPRPAALLAGAHDYFWIGDERADDVPLLVRQVHLQSQITNEIGRRSRDRRPTRSDRDRPGVVDRRELKVAYLPELGRTNRTALAGAGEGTPMPRVVRASGTKRRARCGLRSTSWRSRVRGGCWQRRWRSRSRRTSSGTDGTATVTGGPWSCGTATRVNGG
jgi:hypothetical protein